MTLAQLNEIVVSADKKAITKQLKELGCFDCKKHREYSKINLETLFDGELRETEEFPDGKNKRLYQGGIITQVNGYEQLEFVLININDNKNAFPIDILIWAKAV